MTLPPKSLLELKFETTPNEYAGILKEGGKLYWWEKGGFYLVTDYKLAEIVMRSSDFSADRSSFFISRMPNLDLNLIGDFFSTVMKMMVMSDGEEHQRRRKIGQEFLTDERLDFFKPFIERTVSKLLDRALNSGKVDFVSGVAEILPAVVLADLLGIDKKERAEFYRWSNNMTQFFGGASQYRNEDGIEVNNSAKQLLTHFRKFAEKRFGKVEDEVISQLIMLLVAGQITTTDQICNNLYTFLTTPGVVETIRRRPELLPCAIEEANRWDPAVTYLFRVTNKETVLGGRTLPKGATVFVSTHAVNRDERVFPNPEEFVLERKLNPHFAFGYGAHFCIGAKLARIQMQVLFAELFKRTRRLELDLSAGVERKHDSLAFSGFRKLNLIEQIVEFTEVS